MIVPGFMGGETWSLKVIVNGKLSRTFYGKDPPCGHPGLVENVLLGQIPRMMVLHLAVLDYCKTQLNNLFLILNFLWTWFFEMCKKNSSRMPQIQFQSIHLLKNFMGLQIPPPRGGRNHAYTCPLY